MADGSYVNDCSAASDLIARLPDAEAMYQHIAEAVQYRRLEKQYFYS